MIGRNLRLPVHIRLSLRELREGLQGFRIFLACLILGVTAIAGVGSLTSALIKGMTEEGRSLLAADAEVRLFQRQLMPAEKAYLQSLGEVSPSLNMRTNAFAPKSGERTLVELRAVSDDYPFYGSFHTRPQLDHGDKFAKKDGRWGAVIDATLADRLKITVGDRVNLGQTSFHIRAIIENEPDRANFGFQLGPRVMIGWQAVPETGLVQIGSLVNYRYKLKLPADFPLEGWRERVEEQFPDGGWSIRTRENSAPGIRRVVKQMGTFLTLVGLTALVVGGVGVGNAVRAYLDRKTDTIATFKILGATGWGVFQIYLTQVIFLAGLAVFVGLILGAGLPFALSDLLSDRLPIPPRFGIYPKPLIIAAIYGILITLVFTIWPLGEARDTPAARLFRTIVSVEKKRPRRVYQLLVTLAATLTVAVAIGLSDRPSLAAGFAVAAIVSLLLLRAVGKGLEVIAARMPRTRKPALRLAIANLHRPGAATGPVVISLGLGLTLFSALALIEGNLSDEVTAQIPDRAPAFFFVDIQPHQHEAFIERARAIDGVENLTTVPSLRGTITKVKGIPAEDWDTSGGSGWVLNGDRSLSYATDVPEENEIVEGSWWEPDYTGPPLISFSAEEARELGLAVGDVFTLSILGRDIDAEIASLRELDWGSFGFNFVILFDPNTLKSAPHSYMATLEASGNAEERAYRTLTDAFPNVTAVRIKEVLASFSDLLGDVANAVRITAAIAIVAGVLVLAGAMAAGHRNRVYDSVVMKVLGATRRDVLRAYIIEYALLGALTGIVALFLGGLGGYVVIRHVLEINFVLQPAAMVLTIIAAVIVTVSFGLVSTWTALSVRPAQLLRTA